MDEKLDGRASVVCVISYVFYALAGILCAAALVSVFGYSALGLAGIALIYAAIMGTIGLILDIVSRVGFALVRVQENQAALAQQIEQLEQRLAN